MTSCDCQGKMKRKETEKLLEEPRNDYKINLLLKSIKDDYLYHLDLGTAANNLEQMFGDVKFVCLGGTEKRMDTFANYIMNEIGYRIPVGTKLRNLSENSGRFCLFKVGPILSVNHGMGAPSIGILLHELIKLMYYSKCKDPVFFRIGTCGGIGLNPGSVVVTEKAFDGLHRNYYQVVVLGEVLKRPAILDIRLAKEILSLAQPDDKFDIVSGATMTTDDFYEGQARLDGAFCEFSENNKMTYLESLRQKNIRNIEMEIVPFAAITHHAGIRAAAICVTLLDRLTSDQISIPKDNLTEFQDRPQVLVARYIKKCLQNG